MEPTVFYEQFGKDINELVFTKNFQIAPRYPKGQPGKNDKSMREYRLQLIDQNRDTTDELIAWLRDQLRFTTGIENVVFNEISPNSSKFPSFSFEIESYKIDLVIARGANRGENFETSTVTNLKEFFKTRQDHAFAKVIKQMNEANKDFADVDIVDVKQRRGSTKKEGVPIEKLGAIIGDIVLTDSTGGNWFISLKDINGFTFSSYSGAASLFDSQGVLQPKSEGAAFLQAFGVDLNKVQEGFDLRRNPSRNLETNYPSKTFDPQNLEPIFQRAWGMNYFYVKRERLGWKVFWLDKNKLNQLTKDIKVTNIRYPSKQSKQITIFAENKYIQYVIEMRNSKAGEYPNDTKFKVRK